MAFARPDRNRRHRPQSQNEAVQERSDHIDTQDMAKRFVTRHALNHQALVKLAWRGKAGQ